MRDKNPSVSSTCRTNGGGGALFFCLALLQVPSLMMDSQFSEFTPDITPIMLAAHTNNYEIIKLLVQRKVMTLRYKSYCGHLNLWELISI